MSETINPQLAIEALEYHGWKWPLPLKNIDHNGFLFTSLEGDERKVQFRGRNPYQNHRKPYLYGVFYRCFDALDDMVFWVKQRRKILIVPTTYLCKIFDPSIAKNDDDDRWHVNISFEPSAEIYPVGDAAYAVEKYALNIPESLLRK